jgi:transcriptional regulator with XRE-family HTH domain
VFDLANLRRMAGVTQVEVAQALGTSQGQISRMERQQDMLVSTLTAYLAALGVRASLIVEVGDHTVAHDVVTGREER